MASKLGPVAIATAVNDNGVRLYIKLSDGTVLVENNTTTEKEMEAAQENKDTVTLQEATGWQRSQSTFQCDPESGLAACYINDKDTLVLHSFSNRLYFWLDSPSQSVEGSAPGKNTPWEVATSVPSAEAEAAWTCTPGSQLAIVTNPSHTSYALFFQDTEGYIVTSTAKEDLIFSKPERLVKAVNGSGLGVTAWTGIQHRRLYYQDEQYAIQEMVFGDEKHFEWVKGKTVSTEPTALTSISAIHWYSKATGMSELRVYYQTGPVKIAERCCGKDTKWAWTTGTTIFNTFVASYNLQAFLRSNNNGNPVITLWGATQERVLVQRVYNHANGWLGATCYPLPRTHHENW